MYHFLVLSHVSPIFGRCVSANQLQYLPEDIFHNNTLLNYL